jgi:hypothetical protein
MITVLIFLIFLVLLLGRHAAQEFILNGIALAVFLAIPLFFISMIGMIVVVVTSAPK